MAYFCFAQSYILYFLYMFLFYALALVIVFFGVIINLPRNTTHKRSATTLL